MLASRQHVLGNKAFAGVVAGASERQERGVSSSWRQELLAQPIPRAPVAAIRSAAVALDCAWRESLGLDMGGARALPVHKYDNQQ